MSSSIPLITPEEVKNSRKWFDEKITALARRKYSANQILTSKKFTMRTEIIPGKLYYFFYDAKHKETLPYWDQFPMIFPFAADDTSFRGLNLHYLEYKPRMALLQELLKVNGNKNISDINKIRCSWELVSSMSKLAPAKACVKMYLYDHIASPFAEVPPEFWHTAMMLPVQRFVGASKEYVWADSAKKARRR